MQQQQPGGIGTYNFSAQPQVIRRGPQMYRDPYKDFVYARPILTAQQNRTPKSYVRPPGG